MQGAAITIDTTKRMRARIGRGGRRGGGARNTRAPAQKRRYDAPPPKQTFTRTIEDALRDFPMSFNTYARDRGMKCEQCTTEDPDNADFFINGKLFKSPIELRSLPNYLDEKCARLPVFYEGRVPFIFREEVPLVALEVPSSAYFYVIEKTALQGYVAMHRHYTPVRSAREAQAPFTKLVHDRAEYVYVPWEMLRRASLYTVPVMRVPIPSPAPSPQASRSPSPEQSPTLVLEKKQTKALQEMLSEHDADTFTSEDEEGAVS